MSKYLDLQGLTLYDLAIKLYIDNSTPESITSAEIEELFSDDNSSSTATLKLMLRPSSTYEGGNVITDEQGKVLMLSFTQNGSALIYMEGTSNIRTIASTELETEISLFGQTALVTVEEEEGISLTFSYGNVEYIIDFINASMTPAVTEMYKG